MTDVWEYMRETCQFMLLALPVWLVIRAVWLAAKRRPRWSREILLALLVMYLAGLASQTLTAYGGGLWDDLLDRLRHGWGINLIPGRTILAYLRHRDLSAQLVNLAGNVLIFVPMGILPPLVWPGLARWWKTTGLCAGVSLLIEVTQLFLNRSTDVDDLILNTLGGLLGYLLLALVRRLKGKPSV